MNKGGFSWSRFLGVSSAKAKMSRKTGIPLSKSGRNQKVGRAVTKGCLGVLIMLITFGFMLSLLLYSKL